SSRRQSSSLLMISNGPAWTSPPRIHHSAASTATLPPPPSQARRLSVAIAVVLGPAYGSCMFVFSLILSEKPVYSFRDHAPVSCHCRSCPTVPPGVDRARS